MSVSKGVRCWKCGGGEEVRVEERESEVKERRRAVVRRELEVERREKEVKEREMEMEKQMEDNIVEVIGRVGFKLIRDQMDTICNMLELKEKEINQITEMLVSKEKMLGLKEEQFKEQLKLKEEELDHLRGVLETKEKRIFERQVGMELKGKEINERFQVLEEKEKRILELERDNELKRKEIDERVQLLEAKLTEKQSDLLPHCQPQEQHRGNRIETPTCDQAKSREPQPEARNDIQHQALDMVFKKCDNKLQESITKLRKDIPTYEQVKTREPQLELCHEIQMFCRNMDTKGLRSFLIKHYKDEPVLLSEYIGYVRLAPDVAKFVLDVIQSFYELLESGSVSRQNHASSCGFLSVAVLQKATITQGLKDDALKFSNVWRCFLAKQSDTDHMEIYSFLRFLASYKISELYCADEILSLLGAFIAENDSPKLDLFLCRILGLMKEIPGHIQSLIKREEHLVAVGFICVSKMEDDFPPVPLLKACLEGIQKRVREMDKKGSDTAITKNEAINMELSSLKAVLKCIAKFNLESSFSPAPLELRIKQLEKEMKRKTNAERLMTIKENPSNSKKKGVAVPVIDQSYLVIGKKRTSSSMEYDNQGNCLGVYASRRSSRRIL